MNHPDLIHIMIFVSAVIMGGFFVWKQYKLMKNVKGEK